MIECPRRPGWNFEGVRGSLVGAEKYSPIKKKKIQPSESRTTTLEGIPFRYLRSETPEHVNLRKNEGLVVRNHSTVLPRKEVSRHVVRSDGPLPR